jgi:hypothetical protein
VSPRSTPSTGLLLTTFDETPPGAVDEILDRTYDAAVAWRLTPPVGERTAFAGRRRRFATRASNWR